MDTTRSSAFVPLLAAFALLAALAAPLAPAEAREGPPSQPSETGRYVVIVDDDTDPRRVAADHRVTPDHVYEHATNGFVAGMSPATAQDLRDDERIHWVEGETIERVVGQTLPTGVDRTETDRNPTVETDGSSGDDHQLDGFQIAILDTGIRPDHEDLNVAGGRNFANGGANNWGDSHGHGTHVAGTVGAVDNDLGVVGVAPGASLWSLRVCGNSGFCMSGDIIAGIDWMTEQKTEGEIDFAVANFSISSADSDNECDDPANATHAAMCGAVEAGIVFVLAAGNDNREKVPYPAVFSVSAIADFDGKAGGAVTDTSDECRDDTDDTLADFSNYGENVDIAAPGVCILSTWNDGGYHTISGTSMAAPHVTGAVAFYLHANDEEPATDREGADAIKDAIVGAAHPQGTDDHECSYDDERIGGPLLFVNATAFGGDGSCVVADAEEDDGDDEEAATGTVSGSVTDAETGGAIDGATVVIEDTDLSATTDSSGEYTIEDVPEGTHDVTASADGYDPQTKEATVTEDGTTTLDFALQLSEQAEGTVHIDDIGYTTRGGRFDDRHLDITITILDGGGDPVADASVSAILDREDGSSWNFSGTTGSDGAVTFTLNNHGSGCYETTVTDVTADGLTWDGETPENEHCK